MWKVIYGHCTLRHDSHFFRTVLVQWTPSKQAKKKLQHLTHDSDTDCDTCHMTCHVTMMLKLDT